jgi:3D (Asp-Asp-Asp) domain-containing protein
MKRLLTTIIAVGTIVAAPFTSFANETSEDSQIDVYINQDEQTFEQLPVIVEDRTLVPLRAFFEALETDVHWNSVTKTVYAEKDNMNMVLPIGSGEAEVNGEAVSVDVPAQIIDDSTYVPLRFVGESLNATVKWNPDTRNISIITDAFQPIETEVKQVQAEPYSEVEVIDELVVKSTAYTAYCNGCRGITFTEINLIENPDYKVIAVDPNVIPLGTRVWVEGYGIAVAGDIGSAIKGNKIDLFIPDKSKAYAYGVQEITIKILETPDLKAELDKYRKSL